MPKTPETDHTTEERGPWRAFMLVSEGDGPMQRYVWTIGRGGSEAQTFADALATLETLAAEPDGER